MSTPASMSINPSYTSGRIIGRFNVSRAVAWGQPELSGKYFSTSPTVMYVWKGIAPTFNLFLVICSTSPTNSGPDMTVIDLQENVLYGSSGMNVVVGYNEDLSSGVCLLFSDVVSAMEFEMRIRVILLEAAAQRGDIPFRAFVAFLLNLAGNRRMYAAQGRLY